MSKPDSTTDDSLLPALRPRSSRPYDGRTMTAEEIADGARDALAEDTALSGTVLPKQPDPEPEPAPSKNTVLVFEKIDSNGKKLNAKKPKKNKVNTVKKVPTKTPAAKKDAAPPAPVEEPAKEPETQERGGWIDQFKDAFHSSAFGDEDDTVPDGRDDLSEPDPEPTGKKSGKGKKKGKKGKKGGGKKKDAEADAVEAEVAHAWSFRAKMASALAHEARQQQALWYGAGAAAGYALNATYVLLIALLFLALRALAYALSFAGGLTGCLQGLIAFALLVGAAYYTAINPIYGIGHVIALDELPLFGPIPGAEKIDSLSEIFNQALHGTYTNYGPKEAIALSLIVTCALYFAVRTANRRDWIKPFRWMCAVPYATALVATVIYTPATVVSALT